MSKSVRTIAVLAATAVLTAASAKAVTIADVTTTTGDLSAQAVFVINGTNLEITLSNISTADVMVPIDVLTGVFFTLSGTATLTPTSATLNGSTVFFGPDGGGNVGGEWAYASGLVGAPSGATEGISSTGLGLFGDPNFNGANLQGPDAVDGGQYGITSAGDDTTTGNAKVTGGEALIKNSVKFVLAIDGSTEGLEISNVNFQYGTSLIPEPSAFVLTGLGLLGMGALRRARR